MYKATILFRDGNDVVLKFEAYDEARETLKRHCSASDGDLLYAEISYCNAGYCYTTDYVDSRFGCRGEMISIGDLVSITSKDGSLLYGDVEEINPVDGMVQVSVFDDHAGDGWYGVEHII